MNPVVVVLRTTVTLLDQTTVNTLCKDFTSFLIFKLLPTETIIIYVETSISHLADNTVDEIGICKLQFCHMEAWLGHQ